MYDRTSSTPTYTAAWWLPGPHLQTLWGKLGRRPVAVPTRRERLELTDGDFLDLERMTGSPGAPRLLVLHGLEGTKRSHYVQGLFGEARRRGWSADLLIFRSCGAEMNRLRRSYHSGETGDLEEVVGRLLREAPGVPLLIVGVSLGGNVLLKWLGERSGDVPPVVRGAAAISVPFDLARAARHLERGFARVYQMHFLRSLKRKARAKREAFPDLYDPGRLRGARTLYDFDDCVTAPIHAFRDAGDYYARSSSLQWLPAIRTPTLLLSSRDDPFLPAEVLDGVRDVAGGNPHLDLEIVARGGHVGFVSGRRPWQPMYYAETRAISFLAARLDATTPSPGAVS